MIHKSEFFNLDLTVLLGLQKIYIYVLFVASFSQYCNITMLKCQIVFYLLHYYIRKMYISLQHSNIPMKNCFVFVFVIYCVGVKL